MSNPDFDSEVPFGDRVQADDLEKTITANDSVAGEPVLEGVDEEATGGADPEFSAEYHENDLAGQDIDLDETPPAGE